MAPTEKRDQTAFPPAEVDITVIPGPRGGSLERRLPTVRVPAVACAIVAAILALAGLGAAFALRGSGRASSPARDHRRAPAAGARLPGPAGVAAAYSYPLACLSVTISPRDPAYATARLDRASPCWRFGDWGVAIFRRVEGAWRLVLQTPGPSFQTRGPSFQTRGPSFQTRGPSFQTRGPSFQTRGPSFQTRGPSFQTRGPSCPGVALPFAVSTHVAVCQAAAPPPASRLGGHHLA
jgi:hypothetical protein